MVCFSNLAIENGCATSISGSMKLEAMKGIDLAKDMAISDLYAELSPSGRVFAINSKENGNTQVSVKKNAKVLASVVSEHQVKAFICNDDETIILDFGEEIPTPFTAVYEDSDEILAIYVYADGHTMRCNPEEYDEKILLAGKLNEECPVLRFDSRDRAYHFLDDGFIVASDLLEMAEPI